MAIGEQRLQQAAKDEHDNLMRDIETQTKDGEMTFTAADGEGTQI
jgi:hypothetical protein